MPPLLLLGVPVAAVLAWLALKTGRKRPPSSSGGPGFAGEGLEPGATERLRNGEPEEEPFKRRLLEASGGEVGGPYGPLTQEQSPSGIEAGGFAETPGPTQTFLLGEVSPEGFLTDPSSPGDPGPVIDPRTGSRLVPLPFVEPSRPAAPRPTGEVVGSGANALPVFQAPGGAKMF